MAGTDRVIAQDDTYIEDVCDQLFLLEILVDKIDIKTEGLLGAIEKKEEVVVEEDEGTDEDEDEDDEDLRRRREEERRRRKKKVNTRPIKVKVKLFDFPTMEIDEWDFTEAKDERERQMDLLKDDEDIDSEEEELRADEEGLTVEEWREERERKRMLLAEELAGSMPPGDKFCSGKSCLFPMIPLDLVRSIRKTPLQVQVSRAGDAEQGPRIIGRTSIYLGENFIEAIRLASTPTILPVSAFIDGPYELKNVFGEMTAIVNLYIRISCYGNSIFTQFKLKEGDDDYMFKMSGQNISGNDRINELLKKSSKKMENLPNLQPIVTRAEDFKIGIRAPVLNPVEPHLKLPINWHRMHDRPKKINICSPEKVYQKLPSRPQYRKQVNEEQQILEQVIPGFGRQIGDPNFIKNNPTIPRLCEINGKYRKPFNMLECIQAINFPSIISPKPSNRHDLETPGAIMSCQFGSAWSPIVFPLPRHDPYPPLDQIPKEDDDDRGGSRYKSMFQVPSFEELRRIGIERVNLFKEMKAGKHLNCSCKQLNETIKCVCDEIMKNKIVSREENLDKVNEFPLSRAKDFHFPLSRLGKESARKSDCRLKNRTDSKTLLSFRLDTTYDNKKSINKKKIVGKNCKKGKFKPKKVLYYFAKQGSLKVDEHVDDEEKQTRTVCGVETRVYSEKIPEPKVNIHVNLARVPERIVVDEVDDIDDTDDTDEKDVGEEEDAEEKRHRCLCTDKAECVRYMKDKIKIKNYLKKVKGKEKVLIDLPVDDDVYFKASKELKDIFGTIHKGKQDYDQQQQQNAMEETLVKEQRLKDEERARELEAEKILNEERERAQLLEQQKNLAEKEVVENKDDFKEEILIKKKVKRKTVQRRDNSFGIYDNKITMKNHETKQGDYVETEGYYPGTQIGHNTCLPDKEQTKYKGWKWDPSEEKKTLKKESSKTKVNKINDEIVEKDKLKTREKQVKIESQENLRIKKKIDEKHKEKSKPRIKLGCGKRIWKLDDNCYEGVYIHTEGFYPGIRIGHKTCYLDRDSPKYLGYRWDFGSEAFQKFKKENPVHKDIKAKDSGRKLGPKKSKLSVRRSCESMEQKYITNDPLKLKNYKKIMNGEVKTPPTLSIYKQPDGKYIIRLCPTEDPLRKTDLQSPNPNEVAFRINPRHPDDSSSNSELSDDDTSTVSDDSMLLNVTAPIALYKYLPPIMNVSRGLQCYEDEETKTLILEESSEAEITFK